MAQSTTSTTPDPMSGGVSPMEQGAALSLGHQPGPAESGMNTPTSCSHPSQDDRKRSRAADSARQDVNRPGHTAPLILNSVHAQHCTLHAMDTTTTSDDRGVSERGTEAFSVASFQSLVAPLSESASFPARSHAYKDTPISVERACWASLQDHRLGSRLGPRVYVRADLGQLAASGGRAPEGRPRPPEATARASV